MPYVFEQGAFRCKLATRRCLARKVTDGRRCKVKVTIGLPYCWRHMRALLGVKVAPSRLENAGKGVFAVRNFKKGEFITPYDGEILSKRELDKRYPGEETVASYTLRYKMRNRFIDSACERSVGAIFNMHPERKRNNVHLVTAKSWARKKRNRSLTSALNNHIPVKHRKSWRLIAVASKRIESGDELYADYGEDYGHFEEHKTRYVAPKRMRNIKLSKR